MMKQRDPALLSGLHHATFVVERAVKIVAARVEACGELDEVPGPGVAGAGEAGQGLQQLGAGRQEAAVHAAVV